MENKPNTGDNGNESPFVGQELTEEQKKELRIFNKRALYDAFNKAADAGQGEAFFNWMDQQGVVVDSIDDLDDEQIAHLCDVMTPKEEHVPLYEHIDEDDGEPKQEQGEPVTAEEAVTEAMGEEGTEKSEDRRYKANSKLGKKIATVAAATALGGGIFMSGIAAGKAANDADKSTTESLPEPTQPTIEQVVEEEPTDETVAEPEETTQIAEVQETLERMLFTNEHKFYNEEGKAIKGERSDQAHVGAELVLRDEYMKLTPEEKRLIAEGNKEAKDMLLRNAILAICEDSIEVASSYTVNLIAESNGKYFTDFFDADATVSQIQEKLESMSEEEQDAFLHEFKDIMEHSTFEATVLTGRNGYHNNFIRKTTGEDGTENYDLIHCVTDDYGAEVTKINLPDVDAEGNYIDGQYLGSLLDKVNIENIEVVEDEDGSVSFICKDSLGHIVYYCMQLVIEIDGTVKIVIRRDDTPEVTPPPDESKNKEALNNNAGDHREQQGTTKVPDNPEPNTAPRRSPQGQGEAAGSTDSNSTRSSDGSGRSLNEVRDQADHSHNDEEHRARDNGGVQPASDNQERERQAREAEPKVTPVPAGNMGQQAEQDFMSQFNQ